MFCNETIFAVYDFKDLAKLTLALIDYFDKWQQAVDIFYYAQFFVWLVGLAIVYGWKYRSQKPTFVHVLWIMISLSECILIANIVIKHKITELYQTKDKENIAQGQVLYLYFLQLMVLFYVIVAMAHWTFAIQYFEMVLKISLIFEPGQAYDKQRQRKVKWKIMLANMCFYLQLSLWVLFVELYFDFKPNSDKQLDDYNKLKIFWHIFALQPLNLAVSAGVLIFSIIYFRKKVSNLDNKMVSQREKLMCSHTVLFVLCIILFLSDTIFSQLFQKNLEMSTETILRDTYIAMLQHKIVETEVKPVRICREFVAKSSFRCLTTVASTTTLILFIYMSVKFSQPISAYWKKKANRRTFSTSSSLLNESTNSANERILEQERAKRYHQAAVADANRQISIFQALMEETRAENDEHQPIRTESMRTRQPSDLITLTQEERQILDASVVTDTSSILFQRIRRNAVEDYAPDQTAFQSIAEVEASRESFDENQLEQAPNLLNSVCTLNGGAATERTDSAFDTNL